MPIWNRNLIGAGIRPQVEEVAPLQKRGDVLVIRKRCAKANSPRNSIEFMSFPAELKCCTSEASQDYVTLV